MELIMFVGIPASGKSTAARIYADKGYLILSSDEIRRDITQSMSLDHVSEQERRQLNRRVFEIQHQRCCEALARGQSVVLDATNLSRKRRMNLLQQLRRFDCTRKCLLFITPIEVCRERNQARSGLERVPERDLHRLITSFECPIPAEGWDGIEPVVWAGTYSFPFDAIGNYDQENPHHTLTLDAHIAAAEEFCRSYGFGPMLERIAHFHDIGKLYTKRFENYRGDPTSIAHYYGHESYSALLYLAHMCCGKELNAENFQQVLYEAALIGSHMRPLTQWKESPRARDKDIALFGEKFVQDLEKLHQADRAAH